MLQEIKLTITENSKVLETITKETCTQPCNLVKSVEEFQRSANATLTKMIEYLGHSGDAVEMEDEEGSSDDSEDNDPVSPKKKKK